MDQQFEFPQEVPDWRKDGLNQKIYGSKLVNHYPIDPIPEHPRLVEFEFLDTDDVWAMGPNTRFSFRGVFQCMTPPKGEAPEIPWANCKPEELDKVIVQPNWFECLIDDIEIYNGFERLTFTLDEKGSLPFLNAWRYNFMDKIQKKKLCPEDCNPGFGVPSKIGEWDMDNAEGEWRKHYGPKIFTGESLEFDYVPLNIPPFFQGSNYLEEPPKVWPMPNLSKITYRIRFHEKLDLIFKKKGSNDKLYRFIFTSCKLVAEHLRLNPTFAKTLLNKPGVWSYPGVTKKAKRQQIPEGSKTYQTKWLSTHFPEGIFIFAVPKQVIDKNYDYNSSTDTNVFSKHNISKFNFTFGGHSFFLDCLNIGDIRNNVIEKKQFFDSMSIPPFGMKMDLDKITKETCVSGWENTPYPHVYVNLCNGKDKSRILPVVSDGSILENPKDMEFTLTFGEGGATKDVVYVIYIFYTDNNLLLNLPDKSFPYFSNPYLPMQS